MNTVILNSQSKDRVDEENITPRMARDVERRTIVCHTNSCEFGLAETPCRELASIHGKPLKIVDPRFICLKTIGISAEIVGIMSRRSSLGGGETSRKTLILCRCWESTKWIHGNKAGGRDSNIARSRSKRRVPIGIAWRLKSCRRHRSPIQGGGKGLRENALEAAPCLGKTVRGLFGWLWPSLALSCTADTNSTRSNTAWGLKTKGWTGKGGRIYSRHPNPGFVYLEKVGNE